MGQLFFNLHESIFEVSKRVFKLLGSKENFFEGDSSHVVGDVYYSWSLLGVSLKLEMNGYDYEDEYNYMLSIKRDIFSDIELDDEIVKEITIIVRRILLKNLKLSIAQEVSNGVLEVFADVG